MAHHATCCETHLLVLEMEPGRGKEIMVADMVIMHVADHDVGDGAGINAQPREAGRGAAQEMAPRRRAISSLKPMSTTIVRSCERITQTK